MRRDVRMAWSCVISAARGFHWAEYAPFGWILGAQITFLLLAVTLDAPLSMATVGALVEAAAGDAALHYPDFFLHLPKLATLVNGFLYTVPGAVLIPLSLIRMQRRVEPEIAGAMATGAWLRRAVPPTLVAWLTQAGLLLAWDSIVGAWVSRSMSDPFSEDGTFLTAWSLNLVGATAIAALFLYVPIVAVRDEGTFTQTLRDGLVEGLAVFRHTWVFMMVLSLPALPFLFLAQSQAEAIVTRLQPELVALLLGVFAAVMSIANCLIFATARLLHSPIPEEE